MQQCKVDHKTLRQAAMIGLICATLSGCSSIGDLFSDGWDSVGAVFDDGGTASANLRRDVDAIPDVNTVPRDRVSIGDGGIPEALVGDEGRALYDDTLKRVPPAALRPLEEPPPAPLSPMEPQASLDTQTETRVMTGSMSTSWAAAFAVEEATAPMPKEDSADSFAERFRAATSGTSGSSTMSTNEPVADTPYTEPARTPTPARADEGNAAPLLPSGSSTPATIVIGADGVEAAEDGDYTSLTAAQHDPRAFRISSHVATITFGKGSARLTKRDMSILDSVVKIHKETGGKLRVIGHASSRTADMDEIKHKMVNFRISSQRANTVAAALLKRGVTPEDLYAGAVSDSEPLYYEVMPAGEIGNQRAEIFIDY